MAKPSFKEKFRVVELTKIAKQKYYSYGISVLEDRAFPDYRDGLAPSRRRLLYAAYKMGLHNKASFVKSARVVGETMGRFHPHGDSSLYGSLVKMTKTNSAVPYFDGAGNYGSFSNQSYAAMRYTETRLAKFADAVIFNKFYIPTIEYVPNYDSKEVEPLLLPALLPLLFLNGTSGMAPGATTESPTFTLKSVKELLKLAYSGTDITPKVMYKTLRFRAKYGGMEKKPVTKEEKQDRMAVFKTSRGKVTLLSNLMPEYQKGIIKVDRFANVPQMETLLSKLHKVPGVKASSSTYPMDVSSKDDKYGVIQIPLEKQKNSKEYEKVTEAVNKALSSNENYFLNFTERYIDQVGLGQARVRSMSLHDVFQEWYKWRLELEKKACTYWIADLVKQIRKLELLILAVDNRKLIIESLDKGLSQADLEAWLAKKLKISVEEAHTIYELRIIQLNKLEKKEIIARKAEVEKEKSTLEKRKKNPEPFMLKQLDELV